MPAGKVTIKLGGGDGIAAWRCPNKARSRYRYDAAAGGGGCGRGSATPAVELGRG